MDSVLIDLSFSTQLCLLLSGGGCKKWLCNNSVFDLEFDLGPNKVNDRIEENDASVEVSMVTFEWTLLPVYNIMGPTFLHPASLSNGRALGSFSRCSYSARQQEAFEVKKEDTSVFLKEG